MEKNGKFAHTSVLKLSQKAANTTNRILPLLKRLMALPNRVIAWSVVAIRISCPITSGRRIKKAILAMSEPTGGNSLFALANRARHQIGVITTPIRFESVALNRAAPALPPLFAVNTVDEKIVDGSTERKSSPG